MICRKCQGGLEPIVRGGKFLFNFCRPCKAPYSAEGYLLLNTGSLSSSFNPLGTARDMMRKMSPGLSSVAQTALEAFLMQGLWEIYFAGIKDGILLAYSQDVGDGGPLGEEDRGGLLSGAPDDPRKGQRPGT